MILAGPSGFAISVFRPGEHHEVRKKKKEKKKSDTHDRQTRSPAV
jgi:hypothetical protein